MIFWPELGLGYMLLQIRTHGKSTIAIIAYSWFILLIDRTYHYCLWLADRYYASLTLMYNYSSSFCMLHYFPEGCQYIQSTLSDWEDIFHSVDGEIYKLYVPMKDFFSSLFIYWLNYSFHCVFMSIDIILYVNINLFCHSKYISFGY